MEHVDVTAEDVFVRVGDFICFGLVAVAGVELAEEALTHGLVRDDVDGLVSLSVIHARELGVVAQLVVHLDALYGLCGQRVERRGHILAEELLAVDEYLLHGLALSLDRTVGDRYTRHLLQQALHVGIIGHLEGFGVVAHRIALLRGAYRLHLLDYGLDLGGRLRELEGSQILRRGRHGDLLREVVVSEERYGQVVFAALKSGDIGLAVEARSVILGIGAAVGEFEFDDRTRNALLCLGVDDGHRNLAVLRIYGGSKAGNEKCCQKSLHA